MKIKTNLTISFTLVVALILMIFSASVYYFYVSYRQDEFFNRLKYRAINSATLLLDINEVDSKLLKKIDDNTLSNMNDLAIIIHDKNKKLLYSNIDSSKLGEVINSYMNFDKENEDFDKKNKQYYLTLKYIYKNEPYYIIASANDTYGREELGKLVFIIKIVFVSSLVLVLLAGFINTRQALRPLVDLITQINSIGASNIDKRIKVTSGDEVAELASNFNKMLDRITVAVETERLFVSNASHELRTPVTSIKGQIEVALINQRNVEEYKEILRSMQDDVHNMTVIINGFLEMAQVDAESDGIARTKIRVDDILYSIQDEFKKTKPKYSVRIEFEEMPDDEGQLVILGNERFLKIMFSNLIDNGCKFSENHSVSVKLDCSPDALYIKVIDNGVGIPFDEIQKVTQPLFRASNARGQRGHGIGLSIVKKISDMHNAQLDIQSNLHFGTTITVTFAYLPKELQKKSLRKSIVKQIVQKNEGIV